MNPFETLLDLAPEIEASLGYSFLDKELLALALIHRSFFNEHQEHVPGHNERLEFLGDSVLGLIVSGYLYTHLPSCSEGHLSHLRSHLVGAEMCYTYIQQWELEKYFLLGKGEAVNVGRGRERILADLFEALIGALYLDGGLQAAEACFLDHFSSHLDQTMKEPLRNWKAELQDYCQKKLQKPPTYEVLQEGGPAHCRTFLVGVFLEESEMGRGEGPSKKQAEQAAAEDALRRIEKEESNGEN